MRYGFSDANVQLKSTGKAGWIWSENKLVDGPRSLPVPGISRVWRIDLLLVPCTLMMDPRGNMAAPQHTLHSNNSVIRSSGTTRQGSLLTSCQSSPFLSTSFRLDKPSQTQFLSCQRLPLYLTAPLFACFSIQKARCRSVFQLHQGASVFWEYSAWGVLNYLAILISWLYVRGSELEVHFPAEFSSNPNQTPEVFSTAWKLQTGEFDQVWS